MIILGFDEVFLVRNIVDNSKLCIFAIVINDSKSWIYYSH